MRYPPDTPDDRLIAACNAGDPDAFEALYHRHRDWAVRVAYRFTSDRDEALDVMQESFAYLLGRFPGFSLSAKLTSLLYIVIKHNALSHRRKLKRRVTTPDPAQAQEAPPHDPEASERSERLNQAIQALPDAHREALLMRFVDRMSVAEIAIALSIPEGTVKSRLHHAVRSLRDDPRSAGYFTGDPPAPIDPQPPNQTPDR